jgi:hypothetical protein
MRITPNSLRIGIRQNFTQPVNYRSRESRKIWGGNSFDCLSRTPDRDFIGKFDIRQILLDIVVCDRVVKT